MACISCELYEKRVTNVYRDEELKEKFEKLIGYRILLDCFICDKCNSKLQEALEFQEKCIKVYKKNNPNYQQYEKQTKENEYLILQTSDEFNNEEASNTEDQYTVFEINTGDKEVDLEESPRKKHLRPSTKLKNEKSPNCLIINSQSVVEDNMLNEDPLSSETNNISFQIEHLNESSEGTKKRERKSYTVEQKLEMIEFAEQNGNRETARKFELNESTIRCFRRQKDTLLGMDLKKSTNRHGTPYWPELEKYLKDWTEKQSVKPKMNDVREEALKIAKEMGYENFSGSNTYVFKFMQRNNIEAASPRPRKKLKVEPCSDSS